MRMTGNAICRVWSRVPGLSEHWCMQIQWRIGMDDEVIAALTEPRYPCADESLETIILTQTIYLCQLLLHLQEFDPCTGVVVDDTAADEELLRVFQDSIAREYNVAYDTRLREGPAPDGETLERVVRGLMRAELEGPQQQQQPAAATTATAAPPPPASAAPPPPPPTAGAPAQPTSPGEQTRARLQQVLARTLAELNAPLLRRPTRYEERFGPRADATWAARFATRVMQWRHLVRDDSAALVRDVVEVQPHDVFPLDEEGMQVYQIVRNAAPGRIHLASPLQPEMPYPRPRAPDDYAQHHHPHPHQHYQQQQQQHQHSRSVSSGVRAQQQVLASPAAHTPVSTPSEGPDTPRTTPQYAPQPLAEGGSKRQSQDLSFPSAKRLQLMVPASASSASEAAAAATIIPIRGGPMDIDGPDEDAEAVVAAAQRTNALLRRVLSGVAELGHKIDSMQQGMDDKIEQLDERLQRIQESLV